MAKTRIFVVLKTVLHLVVILHLVVMEQPDRLSRLSDVFYKLESESKKRYIEKISLINNEDPFALKKTDLSQDESLLPSLR